jgi:hypothetical protein
MIKKGRSIEGERGEKVVSEFKNSFKNSMVTPKKMGGYRCSPNGLFIVFHSFCSESQKKSRKEKEEKNPVLVRRCPCNAAGQPTAHARLF